MSDPSASSANSGENLPPPPEGTPPVPVLEHKYKKKRPIYDSDLKKKTQGPQGDALEMIQALSPLEQVIGILAGIAIAYGAHQIAKYILSFFAKKCCALPEIPVEVPPLPTA